MVIFDYRFICILLLTSLIYIPLWLYSIILENFLNKQTMKFTFHYGYIRFHLKPHSFKYSLWFTFHYGYIRLLLQILLKLLWLHLHSTMVIFDSFSSLEGGGFPPHLHSTMVIFDLATCKTLSSSKRIYIPLWLYSIWRRWSRRSLYFKFTFHYGYIRLKTIKPH